MYRTLSNRLASLAMAFVVTFGLMGGIHSLAASEAASAAHAVNGQLASGAPSCARV
jgi:hypothetical protein